MSMSFFKIVGYAVIGLVTLMLLKGLRQDAALPLSALINVSLTLCALTLLAPVITFLREFENASGTDGLVTVIGKASGVAVLSTLAADLCRDGGEASLAAKIELCGKCLCLSLALPLIRETFSAALAILG